MFNKIIKRGQRKVTKSDGNDLVYAPPVAMNSGSISTSTAAAVETLPMFKDVPTSERQNLFFQKLQICNSKLDFRDASKMIKEKEIKTQTLSELIEFLQSGSGKITEANQEEMVKTIGLNIFRSFPPSPNQNTGSTNNDQEEDEPYLDPSWVHLHLIYELLLRYVLSSDTDVKIAKGFINHSFVLKLLDLFDSDDSREREYLKTILHRIYGKFMVHRPFIRKSINNVFYRFVYETEKHNGIAEFLEILGSIINGFALPMKEEHKLFLVRALIPLHKPKSVGLYHQPLSYCVIQFVEKDCKLAECVIRGLLKYWPVSNSHKEVLFLGELEEVLEATQLPEFQRCMVPVSRRIARCLNSSHFQVAERSLLLWNNEYIISLMTQNRNVVFPIIFEAMEKNVKSHWNQAVHGLTANVLKMLSELDIELFEECKRQYLEKEAKAKELEEQRQLTWLRLAAAGSR